MQSGGSDACGVVRLRSCVGASLTCWTPPPHPKPPHSPPGPKEKLDSTAVSQPAIYVASLAALEKLKAEQGEEAAAAADVTCGLSLGEYTALTYAGECARGGWRPLRRQHQRPAALLLLLLGPGEQPRRRPAPPNLTQAPSALRTVCGW